MLKLIDNTAAAQGDSDNRYDCDDCLDMPDTICFFYDRSGAFIEKLCPECASLRD